MSGHAPIQARAAGVNLPIIATFTRARAEYRLLQHAGAGVERLERSGGKRVSYVVEGSGSPGFPHRGPLNRAA